MKKSLFFIASFLVIATALFAASKKEKEFFPPFAANPLVATDAIYGAGYGEGKDLALALTVAKNASKVDISNQIKTQVEQTLQKYFSKTGTASSDFATKIGKSITSDIVENRLVSLSILKQEIKGKYQIWVLSSYSKEEFVKAFADSAKNFFRRSDLNLSSKNATDASEILAKLLENSPTTSCPVR